MNIKKYIKRYGMGKLRSPYKRRFLSQREMRSCRYGEDVMNSIQKREGDTTTMNITSVCSCGAKGCFIHARYNP